MFGEDVVEDAGEGRRNVVGVVGNPFREVRGERVVGAGIDKVEEGGVGEDGRHVVHPGGE